MKLSIFLIAVIGVLLSACSGPQHASDSTVQTNTPQPLVTPLPTPESLSIPKPPFRHGFSIETKYDKFKDHTKVSLGCKVYTNGPFALFLDASGTYPQQTPTPPETVKFGLVAFSGKIKYQKSRHLIVLADGRRFDLGDLDHNTDPESDPFVFETMLTSVAFKTLLQIVNSKSVEMQLNDIEFKLSSENLEALRDFASRFAQN